MSARFEGAAAPGPGFKPAAAAVPESATNRLRFISRILSRAAPRPQRASGSDVVRNREARAITAIAVAQQVIRFRIADHLLGGGIEIQRAAEPVRDIRQMDERRRNVALFGWSALVLLLAAANAVNKVGEVALFAVAARSWLFSFAQIGLIRLVFVNRQIALRPIINVADRAWLARCRPQGVFLRRRLHIRAQPSRRKAALAERSNRGLVI